MKQALTDQALALGFAKVYITRPEPFARWSDRVAEQPGRENHGLFDNPLALMPGCKSVLLLVWPYQPFTLTPPVAAISAYYIASNAAYHASMALGEWLRARRVQVLARPRIPLKALAERSGAGRYGRNGLIAAPGFGSRVALQAILTDAELDCDETFDEPGLSGECSACNACVRACPVGAVLGDGRIDARVCLRALPMDVPYPEAVRPLMGTSLYGCDLCQDCCQRNKEIKRIPIPEDMLSAMSLERLLAGDVGPAAELIGTNSARPKRMQMRACLAAANMGRKDLLQQIRSLLGDDSELVADAAEWAIKRLNTSPD